MKHIKHISGVNKLVEAIHDIIQNKQQCQTIEYDIQFICCSCEISENERKNMARKHRKQTCIWQHGTCCQKRFVKEIQKRYSTMDPTKKKELSCKRWQNYQSLDGTEKKKLIHKRKEKYQSIDTTKKKKLFQKGTEKCESMDIEAKRDLLNKRKVRIKVKATSMESRVKQFKRKIREGPYFICTVCNRILYKKPVMRCINNKCPCQTFFNIQQSFDGKEYNIICKTCPSKVIKGELPCQAVVNNMYVDETPTQLAELEKLELVLIDSQFSIL